LRRKLSSIRKIIWLLIITAFLISSFFLIMRAVYPLRYHEHIKKYSEKYDLDEHLVMAIIKAESNYIHDAHSGYAGGLMQITDETGKWISEQLNIGFNHEDIHNPEKNIKMGCYYMSYLLSHYDNNLDVALAAYNAGMGNVNKWLKNPEYSPDGKNLSYVPYEETREYVKKVKEYKETYKRLYPSDGS